MNEYHGKGGTDILGLTGNPSGSWMITFPGDTYAKAAGASFCKAWSCVWTQPQKHHVRTSFRFFAMQRRQSHFVLISFFEAHRVLTSLIL